MRCHGRYWPVSMPDNLSLSPRTHRVEKGTDSSSLQSCAVVWMHLPLLHPAHTCPARSGTAVKPCNKEGTRKVKDVVQNKNGTYQRSQQAV